MSDTTRITSVYLKLNSTPSEPQTKVSPPLFLVADQDPRLQQLQVPGKIWLIVCSEMIRSTLDGGHQNLSQSFSTMLCVFNLAGLKQASYDAVVGQHEDHLIVIQP